MERLCYTERWYNLAEKNILSFHVGNTTMSSPATVNVTSGKQLVSLPFLAQRHLLHNTQTAQSSLSGNSQTKIVKLFKL